jgi:tetratricopeptide (TPR) repeat protein
VTVVAVTVLAAGAAVVMTGASGQVAMRFGELFGGGSGSSRLEIWRTAVAAWRDRPLIGQGPDLFEMVFTRFQTPAYWRFEWSGHPFHAHSIYLHTLATRGVLGLAAASFWAVALGAVLVGVWRRRASVAPPGLVPAALGVIATCAVAGAFGALGIAGALLIVVLSAAAASAAEVAPEAAPAAEPRAGRRAGERSGAAGVVKRGRPTARRWAARSAALAAALATALWGLAELRASRAGSAAQAFMTRSPDRATAASRFAVTLAPHDDRLWRMHAGALLWLTTRDEAPAGTLAEAEGAARRAVALAPMRAENRLILARALAVREADGDTSARAAVEGEFERSFVLAPMDALNLFEYADHALLLGRPAAAIAAARRAVVIYPEEGQGWLVMAHAWLAAEAPDSARAALDRALSVGWRDGGRRTEAERLRAALGPAAPTGR